MRLKPYLIARNEREAPFARRADLSQAAVHFIANNDDADPRISTCTKIVLASREHPTPDGATVSWEDLHPISARKKGSRKRAKRKSGKS
jgi:hypothetical protein